MARPWTSAWKADGQRALRGRARCATARIPHAARGECAGPSSTSTGTGAAADSASKRHGQRGEQHPGTDHAGRGAVVAAHGGAAALRAVNRRVPRGPVPCRHARRRRRPHWRSSCHGSPASAAFDSQDGVATAAAGTAKGRRSAGRTRTSTSTAGGTGTRATSLLAARSDGARACARRPHCRVERRRADQDDTGSGAERARRWYGPVASPPSERMHADAEPETGGPPSAVMLGHSDRHPRAAGGGHRVPPAARLVPAGRRAGNAGGAAAQHGQRAVPAVCHWPRYAKARGRGPERRPTVGLTYGRPGACRCLPTQQMPPPRTATAPPPRPPRSARSAPPSERSWSSSAWR